MLKELVGFLLSRPLRAMRSHRAAALAPAVDEGEIAAQLARGRQLREQGRFGEAVVHLRRLHARDAETPGVLIELVRALIESDLCDKALSVAQRAHERSPSSYEAALCAGFARQKLHDPEGALAFYEIARRLRPGEAELYDYRGSACQDLGRLDEALADYDRALALRPDLRTARFHRAMARLLAGDFARGWDDWDLRLGDADEGGLPVWRGEPLAGKALLVRREQGLGDEIMFASLLPQLAGMARRCVVECDPRLRALFRRSFPSAVVFGSIPGGGVPYAASREGIDLQVHAASLPRLLRRRLEDFPRHDGYLVADPARVPPWQERLARLGPGLKVGLSWSGGVRKTRRALRSLALESMLPLLRVPGTRFVSLQYTAGAAAEVRDLNARAGTDVQHWPEAIDDYDETAALVCALDLVISVCTSLVHLCGALGRPVWVLAPRSPEWRYGIAGEAMPWYPSVRIVRQREYGRWDPVVEEVARRLGERGAAAA